MACRRTHTHTRHVNCLHSCVHIANCQSATVHHIHLRIPRNSIMRRTGGEINRVIVVRTIREFIIYAALSHTCVRAHTHAGCNWTAPRLTSRTHTHTHIRRVIVHFGAPTSIHQSPHTNATNGTTRITYALTHSLMLCALAVGVTPFWLVHV